MKHPLLPQLGSPGSASFRVLDPATGTVLATLSEHGADEAHAAVDAAAAAMTTPADLATRTAWLHAVADQLATHRASLAELVTAENGKPLRESVGEVAYAEGFFRDAAARTPDLAPRELPGRPRGLRWQVHHRPAGVAALISPWNFPVAMFAKKLAGALAAGCAVVMKPSELTPLSCIALAELMRRAGIPDGWIQVLHGRAAEIGAVLCGRPEVAVVSFTGSTAVGRTLAAQCAPGLKRVALELGGNAPFLVFADADLDAAVAALLANKFRCAGQTCVCTNRVLVERRAEADFLDRLLPRLAALTVGPGCTNPDLGPLIDRRAFDKVAHLVRDAVGRGARVRMGEVPDDPADGPCFFRPMLLTGMDDTMAATHTEVFGPVLACSTFETESEALRLAANTPYGLAAYVFSADQERLSRCAAALRFGHVGLNTAAGPTPEAPFGGMGDSGLGREGGMEGILEFVELQTTPIA
jgi:succinate-semialdehyde dehydrogenase / glutarate-semialdehyde dehydrogenase